MSRASISGSRICLCGVILVLVGCLSLMVNLKSTLRFSIGRLDGNVVSKKENNISFTNALATQSPTTFGAEVDVFDKNLQHLDHTVINTTFPPKQEETNSSVQSGQQILPFLIQSSCTVSSTGNLSQLVFERYAANLSDFLEGPGLEPNILFDSTTPAVCQFRDTHIGGKVNAWHFPHALQQLYRCWSYWMAVEEDFNRSSVLLLPANSRDKASSNFLAGFIELLPRCKIQIVHNTSAPVVYAKIPFPTDRPFQVMASKHMAQMRELALLAFNKANLIPSSHCLLSSESSLTMPRFGILNRSGKRALLNAPEIAETVQQSFGIDMSVANFEHATFEQQVEFFASVDILLSPHGAQLTGIPFLPRCAVVVEIFPFAYFVPEFFGSLAKCSAVDHYFFYLGDGDGRNDTAIFSKKIRDRMKWRKANLCPNIELVVQGLYSQISRWRQCCSQNNFDS